MPDRALKRARRHPQEQSRPAYCHLLNLSGARTFSGDSESTQNGFHWGKYLLRGFDFGRAAVGGFDIVQSATDILTSRSALALIGQALR